MRTLGKKTGKMTVQGGPMYRHKKACDDQEKKKERTYSLKGRKGIRKERDKFSRGKKFPFPRKRVIAHRRQERKGQEIGRKSKGDFIVRTLQDSCFTSPEKTLRRVGGGIEEEFRRASGLGRASPSKMLSPAKFPSEGRGKKGGSTTCR